MRRAPALRCALAGILVLAAAATSVFNRVVAGGDAGAYGNVGPVGRSGASAVVTDDSRVLLFGGKGDNFNGDYLNDLWLYDWPTGA